MSLMARAARQDGPDIVPLRLSPAEAFAAILVAAVAADGELSAAESARLNGLLASSRVLSANPPDGSPTVVESALAVLTGHGLPATLTACAEALPANLRPTAFAQATDLVLADARIGQRENAFIEALRDALGINHALRCASSTSSSSRTAREQRIRCALQGLLRAREALAIY